MYIDYTPEQRAFREEIRAYLAKLVTPEVVEEIRSGPGGGGPLYHEVLQQMGGWNTIQMVMRYAHLAPGHLAPYAEKLSELGTVSGTAAAVESAS